MKKGRERNNSITILAVLLVFAVFAICILMVLLQGAQMYESLSERNQVSYDRRTSAMYLSARVRQAGSEVSVRSVKAGTESFDALVLEEILDGERYETWVYCYDGWLRECFTAEGEEPFPELGEKILPAEALTLKRNRNLLEAEIWDGSGESMLVALALRQGKEAD